MIAMKIIIIIVVKIMIYLSFRYWLDIVTWAFWTNLMAGAMFLYLGVYLSMCYTSIIHVSTTSIHLQNWSRLICIKYIEVSISLQSVRPDEAIFTLYFLCWMRIISLVLITSLFMNGFWDQLRISWPLWAMDGQFVYGSSAVINSYLMRLWGKNRYI